MILTKKDKIGLFSSVGLFTTGVVIMAFWGLPSLLEADELLKNPKCGDQLRCLPYGLRHTKLLQNNTVVWHIDIDLNFRSNEVFAVDNPINYEIKAEVDRPNAITDILFLIGTDSEDFSNLQEIPPAQLFARAKIDQKLIDLDKISDTKFYKKGFWTYPAEDELVLVGFTIDNHGLVDIIPKTEPLIIMKSQSLKIEADENRESRITNKIILGLTWIGIGLAPMLLSADFIFRIYFKD